MIKIGSINIDKIYLGINDDVEVYLGTVKVWPEDVPPTPPSFSGKYKFTLTDDSVVSGECDSSSELTRSVTSAYTATMKEAIVGNCVTNLGHQVFNSCTGLTEVVLPDSITSIGQIAFQSCRSLSNINIPSGVTTINWATFKDCSSLTSVNIPDSVTTIGDSAFRNCNGLASVTIPSGVTSIGDYAFNNCTSLTSITVNAVTPPSLSPYDVFYNTNNCPIYVPSASVAAYKSASRWSAYASRIFAIPSESCIDDSGGTWVTVDGDFNTAQAVYKLDFASLRDAYLHGAPYASASINLYDENQNYIGTVEASYDEANDSFNVTVSSGSPSTVIYNEDVEEVDICSLFGKPLYLGYVEGEPPSYEYCVNAECLQYCCNEWDEESGECIDYNYDCCEESGECLQNEYIYLSSAFVENT